MSKKKSVVTSRETLEEFLQRGGQITKCEPAPLPEEATANRASPAPAANATMMSLAEGALYYAESRAKPKESKKKVDPVINFAALPASLQKYMPKKEQ